MPEVERIAYAAEPNQPRSLNGLVDPAFGSRGDQGEQGSPTGIAARQPGKACPSRKRSAAATMAAKPTTDTKSATGARMESLPHATASSPPAASSHIRPKGRKKAAIG